MIRHLYTIASQLVLLDQISNLASFIHEVEGLTVPQLPGSAPQIHITTLWYSDSPGESLEARHRILAPSGKEVMNTPLSGNTFPKGSDRNRQINLTGGFPLPEAGRYWLLTERKEKGDWLEVHRTPMMISAAIPGVAQARAAALKERFARK
jgi:hypothetical protein